MDEAYKYTGGCGRRGRGRGQGFEVEYWRVETGGCCGALWAGGGGVIGSMKGVRACDGEG